MGAPIAELQTRMTAEEFGEWRWAFEHEPFDDIACFHLPLAMWSANWFNTRIKERAEWLTAMDFLPSYARPKQPVLPEDIDEKQALLHRQLMTLI